MDPSKDLSPQADLTLPKAEGLAKWSQSYIFSARAVAVAMDGSIYETGSFSKEDFGNGQVTARGISDVVLLKYDAAGRRIWAKTFGGAYLDSPNSVAVDRMGVVTVVGYALKTEATGSHDLFVARYAPDGTQKYFQIFGGNQTNKVDTAQAVAVAADGGYFVVGGAEDALDLGTGLTSPFGTRDIIIAHYRADGTPGWARRYGQGNFYSQAATAVVAENGDLLVGGTASPRLDFGDGNSNTNMDLNGFVARFTSGGVLRWSRHLYSPASSATTTLSNGPSGRVIVAGNFGRTIDLGSGPKPDAGNGAIFWGEFDQAGKNLSTHVLAAQGGFWVNRIAVDSYGHIVFGGQVDTDVDFGAGPTQKSEGSHFIMKRTLDGRLRYARRFGAMTNGRVNDVAVAPDDGIVAVGEISANVTLDGITLKPFGYLLALSP